MVNIGRLKRPDHKKILRVRVSPRLPIFKNRLSSERSPSSSLGESTNFGEQTSQGLVPPAKRVAPF